MKKKKTNQKIERLRDPLFTPLPVESIGLATGGDASAWTGSITGTYNGGWDGQGSVDFS
jgi:hypothetical protein